MKDNTIETAYEHGLSKVKANALEVKGSDFVKNYFVQLKEHFPNRKLNSTEQILVKRYQIVL